MAITLTGAGGLFTRLGKIFYAQKSINLWRSGTSADQLWKEVRDALAEFDPASDSQTLQQIVAALAPATANAAASLASVMSALQACAQSTLIQMAHEDNPLPSLTIGEAIQELILQMEAATASVDRNEPTASASSVTTINPGLGAGTGTGRMAASLVDGQGQPLEFVFDEVIDAICTGVSNPTKATFTAKGEAALADRLSPLWPAGSGVAASLTAIDSADATQNKLGANGTLDAITANTPDGWTVTSGTPGTQFAEETVTVVKSGKALRFVGDTGVGSELYLPLTGLAHHVPYCFCFFARLAGTITGGTMTWDLHNGSTTINDERGTANSSGALTLSGFTTSYVPTFVFFRLPEPIPSTVRLRCVVSGFTGAGSSFYIDHLSLAVAQQLYVRGPFVTIVSGGTNFSLNDKIALTVANDYRGDFQTYFHRNFDMISLGKRLPSVTGGSETIADSLIG